MQRSRSRVSWWISSHFCGLACFGARFRRGSTVQVWGVSTLSCYPTRFIMTFWWTRKSIFHRNCVQGVDCAVYLAQLLRFNAKISDAILMVNGHSFQTFQKSGMNHGLTIGSAIKERFETCASVFIPTNTWAFFSFRGKTNNVPRSPRARVAHFFIFNISSACSTARFSAGTGSSLFTSHCTLLCLSKNVSLGLGVVLQNQTGNVKCLFGKLEKVSHLLLVRFHPCFVI